MPQVLELWGMVYYSLMIGIGYYGCSLGVVFHHGCVEALHFRLALGFIVFNDALIERHDAVLFGNVLLSFRRARPTEIALGLVRTRPGKSTVGDADGARLERPIHPRRNGRRLESARRAPWLDHFHIESPWRRLRSTAQSMPNQQDRDTDDEDAEEVCPKDAANLNGKKGFVARSGRRQRRTVFG